MKLSVLKIYLAAFVLFSGGAAGARAQTSAITYQGRLTVSGTAPTGQFDLQFNLYSQATLGAPLNAAPILAENVQVTEGVFSVGLDFSATANAFDGGDRWLEIGVRPGTSSDPHTILDARQPFTSAPYAIRAANANTANTANTATTAGNVTGVVAVANGGTGSATQNFVDLSTDQTIAGVKTFSGTIAGNGANLTNLNGANIAAGTLSNSALSDAARSKFDLDKVALLRWDLLPNFKTIPVGGQPRGIAFDGTFVYVASRTNNNVVRIRFGTGAIEGAPIAVGNVPTALVFDGTFVYVAHENDSNVRRIRASTGLVEGAPIAVGTRPTALAFDGTFVYVANYLNAGAVRRIRASTGEVEGAPIAVGSFPIALCFDGTYVYVANNNSNSVTRINAATGLVEGAAIALGNNTNPNGLAFDGTFVYTANSNNSVSRIRASTGAVEGAAITVGLFPLAIAFDGTFMYTANGGTNTVTRIRVASGAVEGAAITVGNSPGGIVFDGVNIYIANQNSGTVTRFVP